LTDRIKVLGIDFTSAPTRAKPIVCLSADFAGGVLRVRDLIAWPSFDEFEAALRAPGPWIAGLDFPFGQSRRFIEAIGWPPAWADYVSYARALGRDGFRRALDAYRTRQPQGEKEHRRVVDARLGAISPQKLYFVPVGLMFFEGAPRLLAAGVTIPGMHFGDRGRVAVEAYPGALARRLIGRTSYKHDSKIRQTPALRATRCALLAQVVTGQPLADYGVKVDVPCALAQRLIDDPTGDSIDALLCAIQAAWSWTQCKTGLGAPDGFDPLEGWIADPGIGGDVFWNARGVAVPAP
jgi:hypothetical protein